MFWWKCRPTKYETMSPSTPPRKPSSNVSPSDSAPLPASTAAANNNTVPGTISPAIARHSTHATRNTAKASHCGLTVSQPVTLSSHGPIKTTPSNVHLAPKGRISQMLKDRFHWDSRLPGHVSSQQKIIAPFDLTPTHRIASAVRRVSRIDEAVH